MSTIAEIEARRKARKAELQEQADAQRVKDLEALDALEVEHGDTNVCHIDVPYTPGLPTLAVAKMPSPALLKRYRAGLKVQAEKALDIGAANDAAELLGKSVRVYPDEETFKKMCEARPDLASQLGSRATKLAQGKAAVEGEG